MPSGVLHSLFTPVLTVVFVTHALQSRHKEKLSFIFFQPFFLPRWLFWLAETVTTVWAEILLPRYDCLPIAIAFFETPIAFFLINTGNEVTIVHLLYWIRLSVIKIMNPRNLSGYIVLVAKKHDGRGHFPTLYRPAQKWLLSCNLPPSFSIHCSSRNLHLHKISVRWCERARFSEPTKLVAE